MCGGSTDVSSTRRRSAFSSSTRWARIACQRFQAFSSPSTVDFSMLLWFLSTLAGIQTESAAWPSRPARPTSW